MKLVFAFYSSERMKANLKHCISKGILETHPLSPHTMGEVHLPTVALKGHKMYKQLDSTGKPRLVLHTPRNPRTEIILTL